MKLNYLRVKEQFLIDKQWRFNQLWQEVSQNTAAADAAAAAAAAKSLQSCPTLCDPIDGSPSGSSVPGILQARTLEWVAISFSNAWKWKVKVKLLSCVQLFTTPCTAPYQALQSMGFSRQDYTPNQFLAFSMTRWAKIYNKENSEYCLI